jgi:hypothetical protein
VRLKIWYQKTVMASGLVIFLQAVKKEKEVDQAYELDVNRPPLESLPSRIKD